MAYELAQRALDELGTDYRDVKGSKHVVDDTGLSVIHAKMSAQHGDYAGANSELVIVLNERVAMYLKVFAGSVGAWSFLFRARIAIDARWVGIAGRARARAQKPRSSRGQLHTSHERERLFCLPVREPGLHLSYRSQKIILRSKRLD